jgi:CheY-like chemotaxis protein
MASPEAGSPALVLAVMDDLLFLSRIQEAARGAGVAVRSARRVADVVDAAPGASVVVIDLDAARLPVAEVLDALRADPLTAGLPVIGFFSHVHAARGREALAAGCRQALPRSAFVQELPRLMAGLRPGPPSP